jgi:hypothetical protein
VRQDLEWTRSDETSSAHGQENGRPVRRHPHDVVASSVHATGAPS